MFAITLPRERLSGILNETPKPAVSGLSFDAISKPFKNYILDLIAGNPKRDLYEQIYCFFSLEDRKRDPNREIYNLSETSVSLRKYNC